MTVKYAYKTCYGHSVKQKTCAVERTFSLLQGNDCQSHCDCIRRMHLIWRNLKHFRRPKGSRFG